MLTIQIEDTRLEERLTQKARATGTTVAQLVCDLVAGQLEDPDDDLGFDIPRLDVRDHARVISMPLTSEEEEALAQNPDVKPFSHITDAAKYIHDLRRKPRY